MTATESAQWQRLSPRMLLVHPVHEVLNQLPLLIGAIVLGSATQNPVWSLVGVGLIVVLGVARWFTTSYRIDDQDVVLRTGLLQRSELSVPRNRIRSVQTEARVLHRLLGLSVLRVSTGQEDKGGNAFVLDAVETGQVAVLRGLLLGQDGQSAPAGRVLASWKPSWLRYSPLSWSGLLSIGAALGVAYQAGFGDALSRWLAGRLSPAVVLVLVLAAAVLIAVGQSQLTYANLVLTRRPDTLNLVHGLLRVRERTFDLDRLRGGSLREPLLVRAMGGARLDAVMTGVAGAGESSLLLPPCPAGTGRAVLADLVGDPEVVAGTLVAHGPAAVRRRWVRALALPVLVAVVLPFTPAPGWAWAVWSLLLVGAAGLAIDRVRALGHRVDAYWLVTRSGSVERRRDCVQTAGIIGWTVRQTFFQRRAGVATVVAATAAGTKRYVLIDVPAELAWTVAATASPWVADSQWAA
ncbi:PH domain-containing protein [Mycobacterium sp. AMU20-3851]|uniref:PH domain-containing protein n=1 Tax=Mycobacterium sp. AMU20-3851 TaxID=3122055 RepID=UPI0037554165